MTTPRSPEGEMVDIMELDLEIEELRLGSSRSGDRALSLLLELRDDVDQRVATLLGENHYAQEALERLVAAPAPRRRRHHRLAVVPIAAALVLASTGAAAALSGSPHAPLYPLHQLIFGATTSSDGQISLDLATAQNLLDQAAAKPYASRAGDLAQARILLADARRLLSSAGAHAPRLSIQLAAELARLAQLAKPPATGGTLPSPSPLPTPEDDGSSAPPESATSEDSTVEVAPAGGESEAPEAPEAPARAANPPAAEAPEPVPSAAASQPSGRQNDDPAGSDSEAPESKGTTSTDR